MYSLSTVERGTIRSADLQRALCEIDHPETARHLFAIEHIEARGITYSNQDFDVLSAAYGHVERHGTPYAKHLMLGHPTTRSSPNGVDIIEECGCGGRWLHNPTIGHPITLQA